MLDLDGFSQVNAEVGRPGGDEVLAHWAASLTAQLRTCDLLCRYGADEFLVVMPRYRDPGRRRPIAMLNSIKDLRRRRPWRALLRAHGCRRSRHLPRQRTVGRGTGRQSSDDHVHGARQRQGPGRLLLWPRYALTRALTHPLTHGQAHALTPAPARSRSAMLPLRARR